MSALITLADAAEQLDVHYMTAYRYVRTGRMVAEKRAGKWWVTAENLAAVLAEGTGARRRPASEATSGTNPGPRELLVEPFTARLMAGDTAGCWELITSALAGGATPADIHTQLLQTALREIGAGWRRGEVSVAAEHRATASAARLLGQLGPLFRHRGRRRGTIVLGTVAGDTHALPTAMLTDLLSDLHFDVIDLGANTPNESFVEVCASVDDLIGVGLCVVFGDHLDAAWAQASELRAALPDTFLLIGGSVFADAPSSGFEQLCDSLTGTAEEACEAFDAVARSADA